MSDTDSLLVDLVLYGLLPLWGIAGFADWCCHRATQIESTSGLRESLLHSLMGIQLGIPILLCLMFEVNVLILLVCALMWLAHEIVAHCDIRQAVPRRPISIWEMHVHSYLATLPLYLLMLLVVLNFDVARRAVTLQWSGQLTLHRLVVSQGGPAYLPHYLIFMIVICVLPYLEENIRCLRRQRRAMPAVP
jgi:hypothetical protein